ncbi:MAG: hypothetical protein FWE57_03330 [Chitinispirillia bacterium]|nr:hypothetical protein [Chitinispirillia bacterium]
MNKNIVNKMRKSQKSINGMTLLELAVYVALAGLLMAPVIMLMHNASFNMARDANSMTLRTSGRDVVNIIFNDVRGTGFKLRGLDPVVSHDTAILWGNRLTPAIAADISSFDHINNETVPGSTVPSDRLTILKGVLNPATPNNLNWIGFDEITYSVANNNLSRQHIRTSNPVNMNVDINETHIIARSVETLQFQFSEDLDTWFNAVAVGASIPADAIDKNDVRYIKAIVVLRTNKRVAPSRSSVNETVAGVILGPSGETLREIHEIVIPIPNNGRIPPN